MQHWKRLIAAIAVAGIVAFTAVPASAWSQSYTHWHCNAWFTNRSPFGSTQSLQATHQVMLLATTSQTKPDVKARALAFSNSPWSFHAYNNLDLACYYSGGIGHGP